MNPQRKCTGCSGSGDVILPGEGFKKCPVCKGTGVEPAPLANGRRLGKSLSTAKKLKDPNWQPKMVEVSIEDAYVCTCGHYLSGHYPGKRNCSFCGCPEYSHKEIKASPAPSPEQQVEALERWAEAIPGATVYRKAFGKKLQVEIEATDLQTLLQEAEERAYKQGREDMAMDFNATDGIKEAEQRGERKAFIKAHDLPSYNAMNGMDCKLTRELEDAFPQFKDHWYGPEDEAATLKQTQSKEEK